MQDGGHDMMTRQMSEDIGKSQVISPFTKLVWPVLLLLLHVAYLSADDDESAADKVLPGFNSRNALLACK